MTASEFKVEFPEFANAPDALVTAKLADAAAQVNATTWGDLTDRGVKYLAARLLALSPQGRAMKLVSADGKTAYDDTYMAMKRSVASGFRVVG